MKQEDQMDLSVILVNWNSLALTSQALVTLKEKTEGISYEVIVVDNGTTKDHSVIALPTQFPWIKFISNSDNRGFSKANNQGIRLAKGRYVLLLNNDTIQIENALGKAVMYMNANPDVGALGIRHRNNDDGQTSQPSFFAFPRPWHEILILFHLDFKKLPLPQPKSMSAEQDVDWVCGSFLLMRRNCLEQVGELDERFFIYDEDIDWCLRASNLGWKIRFWPGASMVHVGAAARPFMKDKTFVHFRSHLSYIRKHNSIIAAALYYIAMTVRLSLATAKQTIRYLTGQASIEELRARYMRQLQFLSLRSGKIGG